MDVGGMEILKELQEDFHTPEDIRDLASGLLVLAVPLIW
jgi:hypothetical protein